MLPRHFFYTCILFLSTTLLIWAEGKIPWKTDSYTHISKQENIQDALRNFANSQGLNIVMDDTVQGLISGQFIQKKPQAYFDELMKSYNLIWFYDGAILYITSQVNVKSTILALKYTTPEQLISVYQSLSFASSEWSIRSLQEEKLLFISGSPMFVDMMSQLAQQVDAASYQDDIGGDTVEVFQLQNAWSYDVTYSYGDNSILVPGMATLIQAIMNGNSISGTLSVTDKQGITQVKAGLNQDIPDVGYPSAAMPSSSMYEEQASNPNPKSKKTTTAQISNSQAPLSIIADPRTNSVIIKDSKSKMPIYKKLIDNLDIPMKVIEITAAIVAVSKASSYNVSNNLFTLVGRWGGPILNVSTTSGILSSTDVSNTNTSLQIQGTVNANAFMDAIQLLEEDSKAKTLSRPSILTLDNIQAVIDKQTTQYVQVTSERFANLFDTSAGITLKVTPHVIDKVPERQIKLLVNIEDGGFEAAPSVSVPVVSTQSSINTQAIIKEGESLLIGGIYDNQDTKTASGIPILRNLPIIGYAFSNRSRAKECDVKFYLITPRIIEELQEKPRYKDVYTKTDNFKAPAFTGDNICKESGDGCEQTTFVKDDLYKDRFWGPISWAVEKSTGFLKYDPEACKKEKLEQECAAEEQCEASTVQQTMLECSPRDFMPQDPKIIRVTPQSTSSQQRQWSQGKENEVCAPSFSSLLAPQASYSSGSQGTNTCGPNNGTMAVPNRSVVSPPMPQRYIPANSGQPMQIQRNNNSTQNTISSQPCNTSMQPIPCSNNATGGTIKPANTNSKTRCSNWEEWFGPNE